MTIELRPLSELDPDMVTDTLTEVGERVQEDYPTLLVRRGNFHDLGIYYPSLLTAQRQQQIEDYRRARSLSALLADPTADPELVDEVLSNYRLTRAPGTAASGTITIVVSDDVTLSVPAGSRFTADGQSFITAATFTAKAEEAQVTLDGDRLFRAAGSHFAFEIEVAAEEIGAAGNLAKDTTIAPEVLPPNFVTAYAAEDFTGGAAAETNEELLARLEQGLAAATVSNRSTMTAFLRNHPSFTRVVASSIIGYGDSEMKRDRHSLWPISTGGRVDWYVRTQERVARTALTKTAHLVEKTSDGYGIWQFGIARNEAPGFHEISSIRPAGALNTVGSFTVTGDVRSVDLTRRNANYLLPDIRDIVEGAYSRYQTAVIQFKDTTTLTASLALGASAAYDVEATGLPQIAALQDLVSSRDFASHGADLLVRAPVPCFVSLNFAINRPRAAAAPDLNEIKAALCAVINRTGFTGKLYASTLAETVQAQLVGGATHGAMDMLGRLRYPDGTIEYLRSAEALTVPQRPQLAVTRRTVQFFSLPEDIAIAVVAVAAAGL